VADERPHVGEGAGKDLVVPLDRGGRIAIERRADLIGEADEADAFGMKHAVAIVEVVHFAPVRSCGIARSAPPTQSPPPTHEQVKRDCFASLAMTRERYYKPCGEAPSFSATQSTM